MKLSKTPHTPSHANAATKVKRPLIKTDTPMISDGEETLQEWDSDVEIDIFSGELLKDEDDEEVSRILKAREESAVRINVIDKNPTTGSITILFTLII